MADKEMMRMAQRRGQEFAQAILKEINHTRVWAKLLSSEDENVVLKSLIYITDRAYGKATEHIEQGGSVKIVFNGHEVALQSVSPTEDFPRLPS